MNDKNKIRKIGVGLFLGAALFSIIAIIYVTSAKWQFSISTISSVAVKKCIISIMYLLPFISWLLGFIFMQMGGIFRSITKPVKIVLIIGIIVEAITSLLFLIGFIIAMQRW